LSTERNAVNSFQDFIPQKYCHVFVARHGFPYVMASSWMLSRVALVRTDVSEEVIAFIIKVTRIGELGTSLAVICNRASIASSVPHWWVTSIFLTKPLLSNGCRVFAYYAVAFINLSL
jgi:hypothetical protein